MAAAIALLKSSDRPLMQIADELGHKGRQSRNQPGRRRPTHASARIQPAFRFSLRM
jgi:hypothetical protein